MMLGISPLALVTSFGAGVVSFLSPCVLPLVPGYISYIAGQTLGGTEPDGDLRKGSSAALLSVCFILGFATVFVILGASATAIGALLLSYRYEENLGAGALVILFGLVMIGLVRWPWLQRDFRFHLDIRGGRRLAAYILGLAFAFGWTPCIGPVLGTILTAGAVSATVPQGVLLLAVYSLGLGVPFLAAALFTDRLFGWLRRLRRAGQTLQLGAGAIIVIMGVAMISGELSTFSYWLLATFPVFARIG